MGFNSVDPIRFGSVSMVTATPGTNDPDVGTRTTADGNEYVFVYNTGGSDINPGYAAIVSGATSALSVTVSSTGSHHVGVGIVKHSTLTTGTYGYVLAKGFCNFEASTTVAAGDGIVIGTDGALDIASGSTLAVVGAAQAEVVTGASGLGYFSF